MVDKLIQNPADNLRRWHGANCPCAKCQEARRADYLARVKAQVEGGTYPEAENLDACLDKVLDGLTKPAQADTRNDRTGEDNEPFQSDFGVLNH
jgi:hypothetical protein